MAFYRSGGGNAELVETLLWTNPNPTSSFAHSYGDIPLSERWDGFKYIGIYYRISTTNAAEYLTLFPIETVEDAVFSSGTRLPIMYYSGSIPYTRNLYQTSNADRDKLRSSNCSRAEGTGTYNNYLIPTKIVGLK